MSGKGGNVHDGGKRSNPCRKAETEARLVQKSPNKTAGSAVDNRTGERAKVSAVYHSLTQAAKAGNSRILAFTGSHKVANKTEKTKIISEAKHENPKSLPNRDADMDNINNHQSGNSANATGEKPLNGRSKM